MKLFGMTIRGLAQPQREPVTIIYLWLRTQTSLDRAECPR